MADISKCNGEGCDKRNDCYRFRAISETLQFFMQTPKEKPCPEFWPIEDRKDLQPIKENQ